VVRSRASIRKKSRCTRRELRVLALIAAGLAVPLLGVFAIESLTMQPDLYDLLVRTDIQPRNPPILGWPGLTGKPCDCRVRLLGYMMDGRRPVADGTNVSSFILVPDAGSLLFPPPQISEEMIDIRLGAGGVTKFKSRQLVWAEGVLSSCYISNRGTEPSYCMTEAAALGAEPGDIKRFFRNPYSLSGEDLQSGRSRKGG
jgi:hypothetical protein